MFISYQKARSILGERYPYIKRNTRKAEVEVEGDKYYLGFIKYPQGWWLEIIKPAPVIINGTLRMMK